MSYDALLVAKEFYSLESLRYLVDSKALFGMKSHEKLVKDIDDFHMEFTSRLATMFFDYTALVVYGEMRHGENQASHYNPELDNCKGKGRSNSYGAAKEYNPVSILKAGESLFDPNTVSWPSGYGGGRWHNISKCGSKRSLPENIYCDMCFSLSHNSSPYVDKSETDIFKLCDRDYYKSFLDFKFENKNPEEILVRINYENGFGKILLLLLKRAINLGFINELNLCTSSKIQETEEFIMNYHPIEWGNRILSNKIIYKNTNSEEDYDDEEEEEENDEDYSATSSESTAYSINTQNIIYQPIYLSRVS